MTGLAAQGHSLRLVRTGIEIAVLVTGSVLGGSVGVGTAVFMAIGLGTTSSASSGCAPAVSTS